MNRAITEKTGDTFLINTRFLLITSVMLGNLMEPLIGQHEGVKAFFLWIFTFHMPLFVFVTGYFARYSLGGMKGKKVLQTITLQYIIFQSLYSIMDVFVFQVQGIKHSFFFPYLLCWFLLSHICWRVLMLLYQFLKLKHPVLISIGLALLIGYGGFDGGFLSLSRTFVYMPFFVIGYHFDYEKFVQWVSGYRRVLLGALSGMMFGALLMYAGEIDHRWFVNSFTYNQLGHHEWYAGIYRLVVYAVEIAASVALLALVPRGELRMTDWGHRTLYVFLLHGFLVRFTVLSGVYEWINHPLEIAVLILYGVAMTILLAQPFVKQWTHYVIEPSTGWVDLVGRKAKGLLGAR